MYRLFNVRNTLLQVYTIIMIIYTISVKQAEIIIKKISLSLAQEDNFHETYEVRTYNINKKQPHLLVKHWLTRSRS